MELVVEMIKRFVLCEYIVLNLQVCYIQYLQHWLEMNHIVSTFNKNCCNCSFILVGLKLTRMTKVEHKAPGMSGQEYVELWTCVDRTTYRQSKMSEDEI